MPEYWTLLTPEHISGSVLTSPEEVTGGDKLAGLEEVSPAKNLRYAAVREESTLMTAVFEWEGGATKSTSFPSDELVCVLEGTSRFTNPDGTVVQSFSAGAWFLVPGGWIGEWAGDELFREFAIVPPVRWNAMFDADAPTDILDRAAAPRVVDVSQLIADHADDADTESARVDELHTGDLNVRLVTVASAAVVRPEVSDVDVLLSVVAGSATVSAPNGDELRVAAGSSVVLHENSDVTLTLGDASSALITYAPATATTNED